MNKQFSYQRVQVMFEFKPIVTVRPFHCFVWLITYHHHHRSAVEQATTNFLHEQRSEASKAISFGCISFSVSPSSFWMYDSLFFVALVSFCHELEHKEHISCMFRHLASWGCAQGNAVGAVLQCWQGAGCLSSDEFLHCLHKQDAWCYL